MHLPRDCNYGYARCLNLVRKCKEGDSQIVHRAHTQNSMFNRIYQNTQAESNVSHI